MMDGGEYFGAFRLATVVVPVAVYFLILGLLNSRRHPQLLTARQDFVLLVAALSPLFILPAMGFLSMVWVTVLVAIAAASASLWLLAAKTCSSWVIYNLPHDQAQHAIERALDAMGVRSVRSVAGLELPDAGAFLEIKPFPLLRNVSIRLRGGDDALAGRLGHQLAMVLCGMQAQTSPMAVSLLLVATAMIVAPMAMVVHRAPEMVRILTDMLH